MNDNYILKVHNLNKSFNNKQVLTKVSFNLKKGEILGVIGPSGCGKTTLLRCIDLLENYQSGEIIYSNNWKVNFDQNEYIKIQKIKEEKNFDIIFEKELINIRQSIGFVFQSFNLWEEKTVLENLILAPTVVQKRSKDESISEAIELATQFGLKDKVFSKSWELSGGQKQRVAIIRALLMKPKMILLDEITSALDPILTLEVLHAIKKLREKKLAMIVVTHHMEFASSLCDRIMYLDSGEIIQIDTPQNLRDNPTNKKISTFLETLRYIS